MSTHDLGKQRIGKVLHGLATSCIGFSLRCFYSKRDNLGALESTDPRVAAAQRQECQGPADFLCGLNVDTFTKTHCVLGICGAAR